MFNIISIFYTVDDKNEWERLSDFSNESDVDSDSSK